MAKLALILHGFPQPVNSSDNYLIKYLEGRGYEVCCPYLLAGAWEFNWPNIEKYIANELKTKIPDVVIGISMGGLILPNIAKDWPKARLVFIASGPNLKLPKSVMIPINLFRTNIGYWIIRLILTIPNSVLVWAYWILDHWIEGPGVHDIPDLQNNIYYMRKISKIRSQEVIDLLKSIDNSEILKKLKNPALVINGGSDVLMGAGQGRILKSLLANCKYIENSRSHFNVFTPEDLKYLDEFL